jgi:small subunit ribosomal protein S6
VQRYELAVIINPDVTEDDIPIVLDKMTQLISQMGGATIKVDRLGRRKLAYPIKHYREGEYVVTQLELESSKAEELKASFRLSEEFLRHLLVRLNA